MKSFLTLSTWALAVGASSQAIAIPPYLHHQRAVTCCGIDGSRYQFADRVSAHDRMVLVARPLPPNAIRLGGGSTDLAIKQFDAIPRVSLKAGPVTLQSIGVAVYESGDIHCTAVARHDGGLQAAMHGGNIAVRVRVFLESPESPFPLDLGRVLIESQRRYFVPRDQSLTIAPLTSIPLPPETRQLRSPSGSSAANKPLIRTHFNEITHVEIELDYLNDR